MAPRSRVAAASAVSPVLTLALWCADMTTYSCTVGKLRFATPYDLIWKKRFERIVGG